MARTGAQDESDVGGSDHRRRLTRQVHAHAYAHADRFFLDEVCGDILHVSAVAKRLTQTHGSYSTWAARRAEQQKAFARTVELRRAEIAELKSYAGHGFKYGGSSSSINKMQMKAKQAEKLEEQDAEDAEELAALQEDMELPLTLKVSQSVGR